MSTYIITKNHLQRSYAELESRAEYDIDFILLTVAAAALCALGFRMNSPAVIIGAMVVSPLLYPIIGIGTALYWRKWRALLRNGFALLQGIIIVIAVSACMIAFLPTLTDGSEIISRIESQTIDSFLVALLSGLAGTFAFFWPNVIEAIAGIAISVALIPPIVLIGIGLAEWEATLVSGGIELVILNVAGIIAGSLVTLVFLNVFARKNG